MANRGEGSKEPTAIKKEPEEASVLATGDGRIVQNIVKFETFNADLSSVLTSRDLGWLPLSHLNSHSQEKIVSAENITELFSGVPPALLRYRETGTVATFSGILTSGALLRSMSWTLNSVVTRRVSQH